ncbi:MAG: OmpA family protein [Geminicoccaceae bacterium]
MIIKATLNRASTVALFWAFVCILTLTVEAAAEEGFGPFIKLDAGEELLAEIHFDSSSTEPTYIGHKKIEHVIAGLKEAKATQLRIVGFTDRTGSEALNKIIAEERAENVADLLQQHGLDIPVIIDPRGEEGLLYPTPDGKTEPLNRCVGIIAQH